MRTSGVLIIHQLHQWLMFAHSLSFHHHLSSTTFALTLSASNLACRSLHKPLPSIEGCGLNHHHVSSLRSEVAAADAPPLSKGILAAQHHSTEELGMDKHEWGPMEWEAPVVSYETQATTNVMAHFHPPSSYPPLVDISNPPAGQNNTPKPQRHQKPQR